MNRDLRMVASFLLVLCLIAQSAFANGSVAQFSTRPLTFSIPELAHSSINKEALSAAFLSSTIAFSSARKPLKARVGFLKQATEPINHEPSARRRPARIGVHNPLEILLYWTQRLLAPFHEKRVILAPGALERHIHRKRRHRVYRRIGKWERNVVLKFLELALSLPYAWKEFYDNNPPNDASRSGISKQTATGKFKESSDGERGALSLGRRAMLGLSGASALGALASLLFHAHRTRSPAPKTQATPSSGGWLAERPGELPFDHDRRILLEAIARQQNFEPVLSRLVLPRSFRVRIADIRKAVAAARVLIADRSHPIEYLPPEGSTVFEVRSSQPPTIAVNAADLPNFASECPEVLLHEIVHLTDPQLAMQRTMHRLANHVSQSLAPYIDRSKAAKLRQEEPQRVLSDGDFVDAGFWDINAFRDHPELKSAAYSYLRSRFPAEFVAWYVAIAARLLSAKGNSPLNELAARIQFYAHTEHLDEFLENVWKYGIPTDLAFRHVIAQLVAEYRMANGFELGYISPAFLNSFIRNYVIADGYGFDVRLVSALARADFDANFAMEKVAGPRATDQFYISRFYAWAGHAVLPEFVPEHVFEKNKPAILKPPKLSRRGWFIPFLPSVSSHLPSDRVRLDATRAVREAA